MASKMRTLINLLNYHTHLYESGYPEISDKEWDDMYFELMRLEKETGIYLPDSPTQKVEYKFVSQLNKVKHNHPMLSLDKTKDWNEFTQYFSKFNKEVIGMLKLDGLTCSLHYNNGKLISAETRGNGEVGEDIFHNALVVHSIPKRIDYKDELVIDGEIICTNKDFKKFENEYKNARNFAAGSIRLLDSQECSNRNLTFIAWNVIKGFDETNSFLTKLNSLDNLGFLVVPFELGLDEETQNNLKDLAKQLGYPIDGLVGRFDDIEFGESLGVTSHHANAAYAFKFYDEEYESELIDIDWTMGRTGTLCPTVVFKPIEIDGTIVERASCHNLSVLKELCNSIAYKGDTLSIFKANAIIPQVSKWQHNNFREQIPLIHNCPVCGKPIQIQTSASGVQNIVCINPNCEGKLLNRLDHYCSKKGMDIKGLSKATLEKLINWGWVNEIIDIYNLEKWSKEWENKPGFGKKSVSNILSAIDKSKNCELSVFLSALGIPLIGTAVAKDLAREFKTWETFYTAVKNHFSFSRLPNFGYEMEKSILSFNWDQAEKIIKIEGFNISSSQEDNVTLNNSLDGLIVCITGKLKMGSRDKMKAEIEAHGGKVTNSISSKTNYLINNDSTSASAKNKAAIANKIPIITEQEFIEKFLTL